MGEASGKRDSVFADEAEHRDTLFKSSFSAPAQAFKSGWGHKRGSSISLIRHILSYRFKQIGKFRTQIAHLNSGALGTQASQEFLQCPRTGGIERLNGCSVDDHR
mgnify:CR=1 FL=1